MKTQGANAQFAVVVIILAFLSYAMIRSWDNTSGKLPVYGGERSGKNTQTIHQIKSFELVNQENRRSGTDFWKNKIVIVNFFFTNCAGICPKMTNNLQRIQEAYQNDSNIVINSLTVDPERDTVSRLKVYAASFAVNSRKWQLLTGKKTDIYRLARNEFMIVATDGDGGPNDFIHSENLVLIDTKRRIRGYYNGTIAEQITQLIQDIKKLKNEN